MARNRVCKFVFNPFDATGEELPEGADKGDTLEAASQFLLEQVLDHMTAQKSPVSGYNAFPKLSKDYAKKKKAAGGAPVPNLELDGNLKGAINVYPQGNRIVIEVAGDQGAIADGHCNLSGSSKLPLRRFIPDDGEMFKASIINGIGRIIKNGG